MRIAIFNTTTGEILRVVDVPVGHATLNCGAGENWVAATSETDATHYVNTTTLGFVSTPVAPSAFHTWNATTKTWVENLSAAKASKKAEIEAQFNTRTYADISYGGVLFDADATSRTRISEMIARLARGDGFPTDWSGWRAADNTLYWGPPATTAQVQSNLTGLSTVIGNREQQLLVHSWNLKGQVDAMTTVAQVVSYGVTTGWPV